MSKEKFVVAIELGSSRAKIGIAGFDPADPEHKLTVYNTATLPTVDSIRYGRIYNIREVTETVTKLLEAIDKKEPIKNRNILSTYVSIGGRSLKSHKISSHLVLPDRREITEELLERLQDDAVEGMTTDDELICIEPVRFSVDNIPTHRPVGSLGSGIAGEFTAVVCNPSNKQDLMNVVTDRVNLSINGVSVRPIALAHLVLSPQETNAGCMLVDFGAETITVAIYKKYALQYLATIPIGSRLITRDIAAALALTEDEAEALKIKSANAMPSADDRVEEPQVQEVINTAVCARLADIIANITAQPEFAGFSDLGLPAGIILTGGGAKLKNFARLLQTQTHSKVRVATLPPGIIINDPETGATDNLDLIALLNEGAENMREAGTPECVAAAAVREPEVVFDITAAKKQPAPQQHEEPEEPEFASSADDYGYDHGAFGNDDSELVKVIDYTDDEEDETLRKIRGDKKTQAERERDTKTRIDQKPSFINRAERIINKCIKILQDNGEDTSPELDN